MTDPEDVRGLDCDWLAVDGDGNVAVFSTAGAGYTPPSYLASLDAHEDAIGALKDLPPSTSARYAPVLEEGLVNHWQLVAEHGAFAFDFDRSESTYHLVAAPMTPIHVSMLPASIAAAASGTLITGLRFGDRARFRLDELVAGTTAGE